MKKKSKISKILLRVPNWIGDAVMSLPALDELSALYEGASITVLAKPWTAPVFVNNPNVASIIEYDSNGVHKGLLGRIALARELRKIGFDMAVLFQNAFDAAFISFLAGIPRRIGFARDLRSPLLTYAIEISKDIKKKHQGFYYINIVEHMAARLGICGISTEGSTSQLKPSIRISSKELEAGRLILKGYGLKDDDIIIGVAPGASFGSAKMYPVESFTKALTELAKELGARVVILGGPGDALLARELYTALVLSLDAKPINLVGVTSLREFMAITSTLKLFLTNDSGPMHVSAALGTPTVAIFGSTSPALTSPLGNRTALIYKGLSCSPCFKRECPLGHLNCLKNLPPSEVVEASLELYSEVSR